MGSKVLRVALWVGQVALAGMYGMAGVWKLTAPFAQLAENAPWTADVPHALTRFIGAAELAGALGVLLPAVTRIAPRLTPLAAAGLAIVQVLALAFHLSRGEANVIGINVLLGAVALFVAWGRWKKAPIVARGATG